MNRQLFGTDGVRGVANKRLTPELALHLGLAAGRWLQSTSAVKRAVVGQDTRRSGDMLSAALSAGLNSAGIEVVSLGVAPTPTVAFAARVGDFGLGAIVSASHNPAADNGIKFVGHNGSKLADELELQIEKMIDSDAARPTGAGVGRITADRSLVNRYVESLIAAVPEGLGGLKIAVDAAHGAACQLAPSVLKSLGATVFTTGVTPNGSNINAEGGATRPLTIQEFTVAHEADIGVAFDGDADRAVFSDDQGHLINGDRTIGIWAAHHQRRQALLPPIVVGTVMSNGGFAAYLESLDITLQRTAVGDKYVAERLAATGAKIGGEQSGHIIFPEYGPTGDGLMTMLQLLRVLKIERRKASEFYQDYEPWPQIMVNMAVSSKENWQQKIANELEQAEGELGTHGRFIVRPSGTQAIIRIMVEADDYALRDRVSDLLISAVQFKLGGRVEGRVDLTYALGD